MPNQKIDGYKIALITKCIAKYKNQDFNQKLHIHSLKSHGTDLFNNNIQKLSERKKAAHRIEDILFLTFSNLDNFEFIINQKIFSFPDSVYF